jgi:protein TonB
MKRTHRQKDLKKTYWLRLQLGLVGSLAVFVAVFNMTIRGEAPSIIPIEIQEEVYIEEVVQTKQVDIPPAPPRPPVPVEVPNDEILVDDIIDLDSELVLDGPLVLPPPPPSQDEPGEDEIFVVVEQPPVLIGGIPSVQKRIKYPEMARKAGIEGKVIVQFVVDIDGSILNPRVVRGIGGGCDKAALDALKFAKFQPGLQRGKPVKVSYSLPISFSLD